MCKHTSLLIVCGAALLAAGCGGGGGGDSGVHSLTDWLRPYQSSDRWDYKVVGTWKGPLGSENIPMYGTVTRTMGMFTVAGNEYLGVTVFQDLWPRGGHYEERRSTLLRQLETVPTVHALGDKLDNGYWRMVIDDPKPYTLPGVFSVGLTLYPSAHYENGNHSHVSFSITGTETVETPAGAFETYRVLFTEEDPRYGTSTRTEWWHPGLGAPVKYADRCVNPGGATLDYTATLTGSTVSVP